jgi:hypothetical protein
LETIWCANQCITSAKQRKAPEYINWKDYQRLGIPPKRTLVVERLVLLIVWVADEISLVEFAVGF